MTLSLAPLTHEKSILAGENNEEGISPEEGLRVTTSGNASRCPNGYEPTEGRTYY
jgi:hypothetical protein